ncbi:MAG: hypothetical protein K6U74_04920 [Firmicutes bacterium]|nr:hypothetical protein [Bacillota bacterium]
MENTKVFKRNRAPQAVTWNHMVAGEFLVDLQDFFYARQDRLHFKRVSREYAKADNQVDYHCKVIKENIPQEFQFNLQSLLDTYNDMATIVTELSYKQGFSDGVRFIMQTLTMAS